MGGRESSQPETDFPPTEMPAWRAVGRLLWPFVAIVAVAWSRTLDPAWIDCMDADPFLAIGQCSIVLQRGDGDGLWSWIYRSLHDRSIAYLHRGDAYVRRKEYDQAIADYDNAIAINPISSDAYFARGAAYFEKKDYRRAMSDGGKAMHLDSGNARAHNLLGLVYAASKEYSLAIREYDTAIKLQPRYGLAYRNRGDAYGNEGDEDRALSDYSRAISLDPNLSAAQEDSIIEDMLAEKPKVLSLEKFPADQN